MDAVDGRKVYTAPLIGTEEINKEKKQLFTFTNMSGIFFMIALIN